MYIKQYVSDLNVAIISIIVSFSNLSQIFDFKNNKNI
jgi:hypothetical protein